MIPGAIILFIASLMIGISLIVKRRAKAQSGWIQVPATVVSANVARTNVVYPEIQYEYVLEGRRIRSLQFQTLGVWWGFWARPALRVVQKYPVGSSITVYVDPRDSSNAVIEPGGDPRFLPLVFTMAAFATYAGVRFILAAVE
jgi:hypothetical protein